MRYQWYVIDLDDGSVKGSNDVDELNDVLNEDQYVVLSAQHGIYFNGDRSRQIDVPSLEPDGDDEDDDEDEEVGDYE